MFFKLQTVTLRTVDDDEVNSMVKQALSVAKVDVSEKYMHTSCKHAVDTGQSTAVAAD